MQTNNLKNIKNIVDLPLFSVKVGQNPKILSSELKVECEQDLVDIIVQSYIKTITFEERKINHTFVQIYGKPLKFKQAVSDLYIKIKNIMQNTGKSIVEMTQDIRKALGYNCSFFRNVGNTLVPVTSDRILKAYELVTQGKSLIHIENALYF